MAEMLRDKIHTLHLGYGSGKADDLLIASFGICSIPAVSGATDKLPVKATEALELGQRQAPGKITYADIAYITCCEKLLTGGFENQRSEFP